MSVKEVPERGGNSAPSGESDRRTANRHAFSAVAEVMDRQSGARMAVRIADISPSGCYADALNIFPAGTQVVILIRHADLEFKATATVIYALPSMGMGIRFKEISPDMRLILDKWIAEAQGEFSLPFDATSIDSDPRAPESTQQRVLSRLLELLMRKSLLTETEGTALLQELRREL